ncbi:EAL domain-containing protein [Acidocella sp.]|uniref:EAL domain-containing protein n=1 Tax=Acidocella sp. TaxID=50710 RepID=UPI0018160FAA|nr:GGDEF domain-containing phosphodiesterase [Acidocella sp.]NNM57235.1 EAL domain-containing protein [Acidocella sp.]
MSDSIQSDRQGGGLGDENVVRSDLDNPKVLFERASLLREIVSAQMEKLPEGHIFLVVINIADTNHYDDIIRTFGYKFADDLLNIRLADLLFIHKNQSFFHVGFWSIGFIYRSGTAGEANSVWPLLNDALAKPLICRGIPISIAAGIGVCDLMKSPIAAEDLLQATYLAGQTAAASPTGWAECNYDHANDHRRAFTLISDVSNAMTTPGEFKLAYQARVTLRTGKADAVEALLRWHHPVLGRITPDEFIPLIEATGLIRDLTFWVLSYAISQAAKWHADNHKVKICVKISTKNLEEDDFAGRITALLELHKFNPEFLELEFSERRSFANPSIARSRLLELRAMGVNVSIDDFATGKDSFRTLANIPANFLKIDRRVIKFLPDNLRYQALVRSMIHMAHEMDIQVVAEGVETFAVQEMLQAWNCDFAEGYLINWPMPADAFISWFAETFPRE